MTFELSEQPDFNQEQDDLETEFCECCGEPLTPINYELCSECWRILE